MMITGEVLYTMFERAVVRRGFDSMKEWEDLPSEVQDVWLQLGMEISPFAASTIPSMIM